VANHLQQRHKFLFTKVKRCGTIVEVEVEVEVGNVMVEIEKIAR
jgi:hypothetical protein